jgi:hypothetical protein
MVRLICMMLFAVAAGVGCGPSDEDVCNDLIDALSNKIERCKFGTEEEVRVALAKQYGSCADVRGIRDRDAIYDRCVPALDSMPCSDLQAGRLDESCQNQLLF